MSENRADKRSKSEQFEIENKAKLRTRRLTFEFEPENLRRVKIQNPKRRVSSCNIIEGRVDGSRKTTTNGLYIKNRPSISKHFLAPVNTSIAQNSTKTLYNRSSISRKRRLKTSVNLDENDSNNILKDTLGNEGKVSTIDKPPRLSPVKKKVLQNSTTCTTPVISVKTMEPSPNSASNILQTLNAAKLCEGGNISNEPGSRSQNIINTNIREQKPTTRHIRVPYRRRVAVSFSNYQSDSPVILSKFQSNRQFDSSC